MKRREPDHDRLKDGFTSSTDTRPLGGCPEPDRLWAALNGELPVRTRRKVVDHLASCAVCAEDWRIAKELVENMPKNTGTVVKKSFGRSYWPPIALAAAALIITAVFLIAPPWSNPSQTLVRGGKTPSITSSISNTETLPRDHCLLRWAADGVTGDLRYELLVATSDDLFQTIVQVKDLEQSEYLIEQEQLRDIPAGGVLVWRVTVQLPDGRKITRTFTNRLE